MFLDLAFHSPDVPFFSPMVSLWWEAKVVDLLNVFPADLWRSGSPPETWFAIFVAAVMAVPEFDKSRVEVRNVPVPTDWLANDRGEWYGRLMAEFQEFDSPPILINLNYPCEARRPGFGVWKLGSESESPVGARGTRWVELGRDVPGRAEPGTAPDRRGT